MSVSEADVWQLTWIRSRVVAARGLFKLCIDCIGLEDRPTDTSTVDLGPRCAVPFTATLADLRAHARSFATACRGDCAFGRGPLDEDDDDTDDVVPRRAFMNDGASVYLDASSLRKTGGAASAAA